MRFIAASSACTTNQLLTSYLKLVSQYLKEYCTREGIARNTVDQLFLDKSVEVLRKLSKFNRVRKVDSFDSFQASL